MDITQKIYSHYEFKKLDIEIVETNIFNEDFVGGILRGFVPPVIIHLKLNSTDYKYTFFNETRLPFISLLNYINGKYTVNGEYFEDLHPSQKRKLAEYQFQFNIIIFTKDEDIKDVVNFFNCGIFS